MLQGIDQSLPELMTLLQILAAFIGLLFVGSGISEGIKKSADPRGVPGSQPVTSILTGGALLGLGYIAALAAETATNDAWNASMNTALSYWGAGHTSQGQQLVTMLKIVQFLGYVGVMRGIFMFRDAGAGTHNQGALKHPALSGAMYIFFGGAAINIKGVLTGLALLMSFTLPSFLS